MMPPLTLDHAAQLTAAPGTRLTIDGDRSVAILEWHSQQAGWYAVMEYAL